MPDKPKYTVIVPAAGVGKRMLANKPKQYLTIAGKTILEHTLTNLISHPQIHHIVLALHPDDPYFGELELHDNSWLSRVHGGKERADSVLAGLIYLSQERWVLVHDAARPCVKHRDLDRLLAIAQQGEIGGILASPVRDTMKRANAVKTDVIERTEDRDNLWHALTPQFFPLQVLRESLCAALKAKASITDEASAIEWANGQVKLIEGSDSNIKITHPDDLALAEYYLTRDQK